jgi:phage terminase large subunit-like protein
MVMVCNPPAASTRAKGPLLLVQIDIDRPHYEVTRRRLMWPSGAMAYTYSAEEPDRLRGPQHDAAICDELAS